MLFTFAIKQDKTMKFKIILVVATLFALTGCSKLNQQNYDKLEMGMSRSEVEQILGKAQNCDRSVGVEVCVWGDEQSKHIKVRFMANNAATFSHQGL